MPLSPPPLLPPPPSISLSPYLCIFTKSSGDMENYNISDFPFGAYCSKSRASTHLVVAAFLQRACSRDSSKTNIDFSKHRIVGMTPDGYPIACLTPSVGLLYRPGSHPSRQPTHQTSNSDIDPLCILPFAPLFQRERVKDLKATLPSPSPILDDATTATNSDQEAQKEQKVWETLTQQGITTAHVEHHPLDDALAFKYHPSTQTRSSRVIPLECHLSWSYGTGYKGFEFFTFPAFRMNNKTIPENV